MSHGRYGTESTQSPVPSEVPALTLPHLDFSLWVFVTLKQRFAAVQPDAFFVEAEDSTALCAYLVKQEWIAQTRRITAVNRAGEGNMNLVLRVVVDDGTSFILKQSRPWAEKYPSVDAPAARANIEAEYYQRTATQAALASRSPRLHHVDTDSHILMMQDLGAGADLSTLYRPDAKLDHDTLMALMDYLVVLHRSFRRPACGFVIENHPMRALNALHMFKLPFADDTSFDLDAITPGLAAVAADCRADSTLLARIQELERRYLATGDTLLHGDFFPGSVLLTAEGIKVIDPEFCFFGDAEFDVGVLLAHLTLAGQSPALIEQGLGHYTARIADALPFSTPLCWHYAGVEILRRLLGLAQLPLTLELSAKQALVATARQWLRCA